MRIEVLDEGRLVILFVFQTNHWDNLNLTYENYKFDQLRATKVKTIISYFINTYRSKKSKIIFSGLLIDFINLNF